VEGAKGRILWSFGLYVNARKWFSSLFASLVSRIHVAHGVPKDR